MLNEIIESTAPQLKMIVMRSPQMIRGVDGWGTNYWVIDRGVLMYYTPAYKGVEWVRSAFKQTGISFVPCDNKFSLNNIWFGGETKLEFWGNKLFGRSPVESSYIFTEHIVDGYLPNNLKTLLKQHVQPC